MADVQIDSAGMRELQAAVDRALAAHLAPAIIADADRGYEAVSEPVHRRLGPKLESWHGPDGELRVGVRNDPLAWWVEGGTMPHTIRARFARALRFPFRGGFLFRSSVQHPGTKAHHVIRLAAIRKRSLR